VGLAGPSVVSGRSSQQPAPGDRWEPSRAGVDLASRVETEDRSEDAMPLPKRRDESGSDGTRTRDLRRDRPRRRRSVSTTRDDERRRIALGFGDYGCRIGLVRRSRSTACRRRFGVDLASRLGGERRAIPRSSVARHVTCEERVRLGKV